MRPAHGVRAGAIVWALGLWACGHVERLYQAPAATLSRPAWVKRVNVAAWAPREHPELQAVLQAVASDYLRLRKNYLVAPSEPPDAPHAWPWRCGEHSEGIVVVRAIEAKPDEAAGLRLSAELYRCGDGALLYRSEGRLRLSARNAALAQTRQHYEEALGADKGMWVPCAFALLQELLGPLVNPPLTEAELEEKIEMGAWQPPRARLLTYAAAAPGRPKR